MNENNHKINAYLKLSLKICIGLFIAFVLSVCAMVIYHSHDPKGFKQNIRSPIVDYRRKQIVNEFIADNPGMEQKDIEITFDNWFSPVSFTLRNKKAKDFSAVNGLSTQLLNLQKMNLETIDSLRGMYITTLDLSFTDIKDFTPLKDVRVQNLKLNSTEISDLKCLNFDELRTLEINMTKVTDLTPLKTVDNLYGLYIGSKNITDFMPIKDLTMHELELSDHIEVDITMLKPENIQRIILEPLTRVKMGKGWMKSGDNLIPISAISNTEMITDKADTYLPISGRVLNYMSSGYESLRELVAPKPAPSPRSVYGGCGGRNRKRRRVRTTYPPTTLERTLSWLAKIQDSDGKFNCQRYGGSDKANITTTSLALLAISGNGNSTKSGTYKKNVQQGVKWLLGQRDTSTGLYGNFSTDTPYALSAFSECWAMSEGPELGKTVQELIDIILKKQLPDGGWGLTPEATTSDISTTLLYATAVRSAKVAGVKINDEVWSKILNYLKSQIEPVADGLAYVPGKKAGESLFTDAATLTAMLSSNLQLCGLPFNNVDVTATTDWLYSQIIGNKKGKIDYTKINSKSIFKKSQPDYMLIEELSIAFFHQGYNTHYWKSIFTVRHKWIDEWQTKEGFFSGSFSPWANNNPEFVKRYGRIGITAIGALLREFAIAYGEV